MLGRTAAKGHKDGLTEYIEGTTGLLGPMKSFTGTSTAAVGGLFKQGLSFVDDVNHLGGWYDEPPLALRSRLYSKVAFRLHGMLSRGKIVIPR